MESWGEAILPSSVGEHVLLGVVLLK